MYLTGRTYLVGSVLFVRRPRRTTLDTDNDLRLILATDVSDMDEAMEVARCYGITSVHRPLVIKQ